MPVWHRELAPRVAAGDVVVLGVIQEQHADRCRLFMQWQGIDWTILHDPINRVAAKAVPWPVGIDEHGIVRVRRADPRTFATEFLDATFEAPKDGAEQGGAEQRAAPNVPRDSIVAADAILLAEDAAKVDAALDSYAEAMKAAPGDASLPFRAGVAYRMRYDSDERRPGDFQAAVDAWAAALAIDPNHYIYRRRIQQYGPRLDKPYPFYDWVGEARTAIRARGETPVELAAEPIGAELAAPARGASDSAAAVPPVEGDPEGKIVRDTDGLMSLETAVVRGTTSRGRVAAQIHVTLTPNAANDGHWNNEAEPLRVFLEPVEHGQLATTFAESTNAATATSEERRTVSFELQLPRRAPGPIRVRGYALFNACEGENGVCRFLRKDFELEIPLRGGR